MNKSTALSGQRLLALVRKESLQALRDPSTLLIAFVLPVILLFLFAYAVSLDIRKVPIAVVLETDSAKAHSLAAAFSGTRYFTVLPVRDRREAAPLVNSGQLKGMVIIPEDFDRRLERLSAEPAVQVITYGIQPNNAQFVYNYTQALVTGWMQSNGLLPAPMIDVRTRFWFNPEVESKRFLIPGAIAIIMTMIGTLLTALLVTREWERGTMEALISTPATIVEILAGKLFPYFVLGLLVTLGSTILAITVFNLPFRGSWLSLMMVSAVFMVPALGQGLMISSLTHNQFVAAQVALFTGFLPSFLLSGFLFEIDSMPAAIRLIADFIPARYFIVCLQTLFLVGDAWHVFIPNMLAMLSIGAVFFIVASKKTKKSLDR